jgi:hypothetical protein
MSTWRIRRTPVTARAIVYSAVTPADVVEPARVAALELAPPAYSERSREVPMPSYKDRLMNARGVVYIGAAVLIALAYLISRLHVA